MACFYSIRTVFITLVLASRLMPSSFFVYTSSLGFIRRVAASSWNAFPLLIILTTDVFLPHYYYIHTMSAMPHIPIISSIILVHSLNDLAHCE